MVKCFTFPALLLAGVLAAAAQPERSAKFPSLAASGLAGAPIPDTAGKVVLVDFCASWCAPCRSSFPAYNRLQDEFGSKGFVVVAISIDTDHDAFESMIRKLKPTFVVLNDPKHALVSQVQAPGMPTSYLIDRNGRIAGVRIGFHSGSTEDELRRSIAQLLMEPAG